MLAIAIILLMLWGLLIASAGTPIGRGLRHFTMTIPAAMLNRATRVHGAMAFVCVLLLLLSAAAPGNDPVRFLGVLAPDLALWLAGIEIQAMIEAVASIGVAIVALARVNFKALMARSACPVIERIGRQGQRKRRSPRRLNRKPANDDADGPAWVLAA